MLSGIVLAAGSSTRMGRPKQLLELAGRPLLQYAVDAAAAARLDEVIVVLGHAAAEIEAALTLPAHARCVVNERYADGQSTSLQAGLRAADKLAEAAVVLLGDQPHITPKLIDRVAAVSAEGGRPVIRPVYVSPDGTRMPGHPVVIARSLWPEVAALRGDKGVRALLAEHPEYLQEVEMNGEALADVDTQEDYERALAARAPAERGPTPRHALEQD